MSLFPAYSKGNTTGLSEQNTTDKTEWLSNSSFIGVPAGQQTSLVIDISSSSDDQDEDEKSSVQVIDISSSDSDCVEINEKRFKSLRDGNNKYKTKKKKKKKKRKRNKSKSDDDEEVARYESDVKSLYFEDKSRDRINYQVETLRGRARPAYHTNNICLGFVLVRNVNRPSRNEFARYYSSTDQQSERKKKSKRKELLKTKEESQQKDEQDVSHVEQAHKNKVQSLNERLHQHPDDEQTWIEYIRLQDEIFQLARYKTEVDKERAKLQKQLSLVEEALKNIPSSAQLFEMKLQFMSNLLAADDFAVQLERLIKKDSTNLALWQALISTMKLSVALCNVNKVNELMIRRFNIFRHKFKLAFNEHDTKLLGMLFESLMFLRHTGHWEHMWQAIKYNLTLNLNLTQHHLTFSGSIEEKKLMDMEEVILTSGLPLNQLWLRIESLRERCHWISIEQNELELVGDSKRLVLSEDVTDFVHPFKSTESNFVFAVHCLVLLKVPLLPTRHFLLENLKLDQPCWTADSAESILPLIYPVFEHDTNDLGLGKTAFEGILKNFITSGPQFLSLHPAQESYLDFIRMVFRNLADILPSQHKVSIYIWWLRFERLFIILMGQQDSLNTMGKKMKTMIKDFLKKEENRNNLHFYREYAMTELEFGRVDSCINILKSAVQSVDAHSLRIADSNNNAAIFSVYKTLCELYLRFEHDSSYAEKILDVMALLAVVPEKTTVAQSKLHCIKKYFEQYVERFLTNESVSSDCISFLPNADCDIISCYAYLLYIQRNGHENILHILDQCLNHTSQNPSLQEQLYECKISLLQLFCTQDSKYSNTLKNTVLEALLAYANNFYITSVWARIQSESPLWQQNCINKSNALWQFLALCLAYQKQIKKLKSLQMYDTVNAMRNKVLSLYRTLTKDKKFRDCPLVWRLYMLFLREEKLCEQIGEQVYHSSINNCPWARCLYIDSAEVAPQKLIQIQDMLREKDLRMHITPAELDILRG